MKKRILAITIILGLMSVILGINPPVSQAVMGFSKSSTLKIDDLTVTNFDTGRKVVSPFGYQQT